MIKKSQIRFLNAIFLKFAERGETNKLKASVLTKLIKSFLDGNKLTEQQKGVIGNKVNAMAIAPKKLLIPVRL